MYKKVFLILCSVILLGVLLSCGTDDYDDGYNNAPPPPDYRYGTITLDNNASPITEIYLKPSSESDWGSKKLIPDLETGETWRTDVRIPDNSNSIFVDLKVATAEYVAYLYSIRIDARDTVELSAMQPDLSEPLKIVYVP